MCAFATCSLLSHNSGFLPLLFPEDEFLFTVATDTYVPNPVSLVCQSFPPSTLPTASPSSVSITSCCNHSLSILLVPLKWAFLHAMLHAVVSKIILLLDPINISQSFLNVLDIIYYFFLDSVLLSLSLHTFGCSFSLSFMDFSIIHPSNTRYLIILSLLHCLFYSRYCLQIISLIHRGLIIISYRLVNF